MIHVLAMITAKPGRREEILEAFREIVPSVHDEQGCIEYGPVIDAEGAGKIQTRLGGDTFVVVEKWESMAALEAMPVHRTWRLTPQRSGISLPQE